MLKFLEEEQIDPRVIEGIREFRRRFVPEADDTVLPRYFYYGKEVWEQAAQALLAGENLLLAGPKPQEKTYWQKIWPPLSAARCTMCLFISTPTPPPCWELTHLKTGR